MARRLCGIKPKNVKKQKEKIGYDRWEEIE